MQCCMTTCCVVWLQVNEELQAKLAEAEKGTLVAQSQAQQLSEAEKKVRAPVLLLEPSRHAGFTSWVPTRTPDPSSRFNSERWWQCRGLMVGHTGF